MKNILLIIFLLYLNASFAQTPYFSNTNTTSGAVSDGTFEICSTSACTASPVSCANWNFIVGTAYTTPEIMSATCIYVDPVDTADIQNDVCIMSYSRGVNVQGLTAYMVNLIPNEEYKVQFLGCNIGSGLPGSTGPEINARFSITIEDQTSAYITSDLLYNVKTFTEHFVVFTAASTSAQIWIEPIYPSGTLSSQTRLAIDKITVDLISNGGDDDDEDTTEVVVVPQPCKDCTSFELTTLDKYLVSGWVRESNDAYIAVNSSTYAATAININFPGISGGQFAFSPQGEIIDGWQKITGTFIVPEFATQIEIQLQNNSTTNMALFDDIRILPYNASMKSFVYDQQTQKLVAELDENNYATFYEYDKEGGLVRVKKETEKGVFTIQETRSSNRKTP